MSKERRHPRLSLRVGIHCDRTVAGVPTFSLVLHPPLSLPLSLSLFISLDFSLSLSPYLSTCILIPQTRSCSIPKVNCTPKVTLPSSGCGLVAAEVLPLRLAPRRHRPRRLQVPLMSFFKKVRGMSP